MRRPSSVFNRNDPEFYRKMLVELRSSDINHRRIAVMVLSHAEPKELREEISKALEPLVHDSDDMLRRSSLEALDIWSTGDIVPIAIDALKDPSVMVRDSACDVLGKHKDGRAIEPVIALLSDSMNGGAERCLEQMGSPVEDAVLAHYDSGNDDAKRSMIQILGAVATEKGLAKLRQIAADESDRALASQARGALFRRGGTDGGWPHRPPSQHR
jgi:HEAT repeat protein